VSAPIGRLADQLAASGQTPREKLQQASKDLEGLFVNELFKAMRATVPQGDGILSSAPGAELFQGMMDEKIAGLYAGKSNHGIGDALYRQLSRRLTDGSQP
jgi:flagellar protein FlgJ